MGTTNPIGYIIGDADSVGYHEYLRYTQEVWLAHPTWRYGQSLFYVLSWTRPDLAEKIRATPLDPFYCELSDGINPLLWVFLTENW